MNNTFSLVWVTEWPPFGKQLPARLAICSSCLMSICNIYLFSRFCFIAPVPVHCLVTDEQRSRLVRRYRWSDGQNNRKRDLGFSKNGVGQHGSPHLLITYVSYCYIINSLSFINIKKRKNPAVIYSCTY